MDYNTFLNHFPYIIGTFLAGAVFGFLAKEKVFEVVAKWLKR